MTTEAPVWIIDDDASMLWVLERALTRAGWPVRTFERGEPALTALAEQAPAAVLTDVRMPGIDGLALAERLQHERPALPVIVMTAHSDLDTTVAAFEGGAFDYLAKPFDLDDAVALVERACAPAPAPAAIETAAAPASSPLVGQAPAMQSLFRTIARLARAPISVLITGESGTGKELVAQALHRHSPRAQRPFVALNTAAIPHELLESELFGHEKGAFTGADSQRQGRFEQADGGTLFLDEIGDMPAALQTRLLRVLAAGTFYRVGGSTPCNVDVRVLAATHQELERRVARGDFREDLYHRLNVVQLPVPALRERREDVPRLASHFLERAARELALERKQLTPGAAETLATLDWPGNVRELENVCRRLTVMTTGSEIHAEDLPAELRPSETAATADWQQALEHWARDQLAHGEMGLAETARNQLERTLVRLALDRTGGHRQEAARLLGWGRNTLTRKIRQWGIEA
jgi:two-component system nitrogen regulation response regulator GlnG